MWLKPCVFPKLHVYHAVLLTNICASTQHLQFNGELHEVCFRLSISTNSETFCVFLLNAESAFAFVFREVQKSTAVVADGACLKRKAGIYVPCFEDDKLSSLSAISPLDRF